MSALPPIADVHRCRSDVRKVPIADIGDGQGAYPRARTHQLIASTCARPIVPPGGEVKADEGCRGHRPVVPIVPRFGKSESNDRMVVTHGGRDGELWLLLFVRETIIKSAGLA